MRKLLLTIILICFWAGAHPEPSRKIAWDPVPGAWGYALEIKDASGKIIVSTEIKENYYSVAKFDPGEYSFRVSTLNLLKQKGSSSDWAKFTVEKLYIPQLKSVAKKQLISAHTNKNIYVTGKNIRPDSRFFLRSKDKNLEIKDVKIISGSEAVLKYKPSPDLQGKYDLVVQNKGDVESLLKDVITIVPPSEAETYYIIGAGYLVNIPFGAWSEFLAPSYTGARVFFQFSVKNPFFENFLFGIEPDAVQYRNPDKMKQRSLMSGSLGIGAGYYYPVYSLDIDIFIKFSGGPAYSILTLDQNVVDRTTSSVDWFVTGGAGLRIYLGDHLFIEPAGSWKTLFYKGEYLSEAGASLCFGLKI
jgi:hypothetical protein